MPHRNRKWIYFFHFPLSVLTTGFEYPSMSLSLGLPIEGLVARGEGKGGSQPTWYRWMLRTHETLGRDWWWESDFNYLLISVSVKVEWSEAAVIRFPASRDREEEGWVREREGGRECGKTDWQTVSQTDRQVGRQTKRKKSHTERDSKTERKK